MGKKIFSKYCSCCGKEINDYFTLEDYAYKRDGKVFCSWSCLRKYEKEIGANKISENIEERIKEHNKNMKILDERLKILFYKNLLN